MDQVYAEVDEDLWAEVEPSNCHLVYQSIEVEATVPAGMKLVDL